METHDELEGYVSIPEIKNTEELIEKIKTDVSPAFESFAKEHKLPVVNPKVIVQEINNGQRNLLYLKPKAIPKQKLGTIGNCLKRAELQFFSGRKIEIIEYQGKLWFNPFVWLTMSIRIELKNFGGENGLPYFVGAGKNDSTSIFYSVLDAKFYTEVDKNDIVREQQREAKKAQKEADEKRKREEEE
jgi:hypothetical protein